MKKNNLEEIFLKNKYIKFKNNKFNIWITIFSYIYLFYRKLYILGSIIFITIILLAYIKLYIIIIIINLLLGITFNKLYLTIVNKKIENYKLQFMDNKLVIKECQKENTNLLISIIILIISILIFSIPYIEFDKENHNLENLYYKIDKTWTKSTYNNQYYYNYSYIDSNNDCTLTIEFVNSGNDLEFLDTILEEYNTNNNIIDTSINNYNFKTININNENYIYTSNYNNNLYIILFNIYKDDGTCSSYHNNIINSIKFKN